MNPTSQSLHVCHDEYTGLPAFAIALPENWQVSSHSSWNMDSVSQFQSFSLQARDQANRSFCEILPNQCFCQMEASGFLGKWLVPKPGKVHNGLLVHHAVTPIEFLKQFVLEKIRNVRLLNCQILEEEMLPVPAYASDEEFTSEQGRIVVQYEVQGELIREILQVTVARMNQSMKDPWSGAKMTLWCCYPVLTCSAAAAEFDPQLAMFKNILNSYQVNPKFQHAVRSVSQQVAQQRAARQQQMARQMMRQQQRMHQQNMAQQRQMFQQTQQQINQTYQEISDIQHQSWQNTQQSMDYIHDQQTMAIREVERYYDPVVGSTEQVELNAGYDNAWHNGLDQYVVSNEPGFDPNLHSTINWSKLEKVNPRSPS